MKQRILSFLAVVAVAAGLMAISIAPAGAKLVAGDGVKFEHDSPEVNP